MNSTRSSLDPPLSVVSPSTQQVVKATPTLPVKESLPIKPASAEKPKQAKKDKGPSKEEVIKKYASLLDELWKIDGDITQAVDVYREQKVFSLQVFVILATNIL